MRFAICNELFEGWAFDDMCRVSKAAGYDGVEVAPFTLAPRITDVTRERRAELRAQAAGAGVEIIGLHWLLAGTQGLYLTSPDEGVRARTADYLVALADATRDLGGSLMVFGSPKQRSLLPGVSAEQAFDWATQIFRRVMPAVADAGVTICMEPLSPSETDFINTCADGNRLVMAVDHPNFRLHLDVKAMSSEATPITDPPLRRRGGSFSRERREPAGAWLRRRRLRPDLPGAPGERLSGMGIGRGVRLQAGSGHDCRAKRRIHAAIAGAITADGIAYDGSPR